MCSGVPPLRAYAYAATLAFHHTLKPIGNHLIFHLFVRTAREVVHKFTDWRFVLQLAIDQKNARAKLEIAIVFVFENDAIDESIIAKSTVFNEEYYINFRNFRL